MPFPYQIRIMFVRIIIITHSDRALFNLNALVSSLGIKKTPWALLSLEPPLGHLN